MSDTALPGLDAATLADALRVAASPDYRRWEDQIRRTGGCSDPIHLTGFTLHRDKTTGEVLHHYTSGSEPGGRLRLACGNRRASRCPACAWTYAGDTYHLIRAGLSGDDRHQVPDTVREHPRVFATLTAPSFGPVHNRPSHGGPCRCGQRHHPDASELGTALDPDTYDYAGAVLFNNHAGDLWQRFTTRLRREIAARAGVTRTALPDYARISYGKVAEFQRRGAVHFHAVIRIDGPAGPQDPPPAWATVQLLTDAIQAAAAHSYTSVTVPATAEQPERPFRWGTQLDIRPVKAFGDGSDITEQAVASYVAKYATKAAETTGTLDRRVGSREALDLFDLPDHTRRLLEACFDLEPLYPDRRLRAWAHMLGFRGHFSTKSRHYSTTLGALRQIRADYRAAEEAERLGLDELEPGTVRVIASWQYAGHGHTPGESALAQGIAEDIRLHRETTRDALADLAQEGPSHE